MTVPEGIDVTIVDGVRPHVALHRFRKHLQERRKAASRASRRTC